ncbi:MAG: hypothetical protein JST33_12930 [Actinobacteria bacterium]|nr:hypothetical protein [Actinomycetota bacterium]
MALRLRIVWPLLRIAMSLIFLWAFLDKTFALGFATGRDAETGAVKVLGPAAWVAGASPTSGFLQYGTSGPLAPQFAALAGNPAIDWLFMLGMGGVGIALLLGIATRLATVGGVTLMLLLGLATWQSENNPIVNEHLIYALVLVALAIQPETRRWSLDPIWRRLPLVHRAPLRR